MTKKIWMIGFLVGAAIIAFGLFFLFREKPSIPTKIEIAAVFKSHLIMYTVEESNIYKSQKEDSEIIKKVGPDELLYVDQPHGDWFPVYPGLVDSIKNLKKNLIGYIHSKNLISTSTTMRQGFINSLKEKLKSENKNINVSLKNKNTLILLNNPSIDENWLKAFTRSAYFTDMKDLGFSGLIITDGRGFERRWMFD